MLENRNLLGHLCLNKSADLDTLRQVVMCAADDVRIFFFRNVFSLQKY